MPYSSIRMISNKQSDNYLISCYSPLCISNHILAVFSVSRFSVMSPLPDDVPKSFPVISFADSHSLNSFVSYRYKNLGEGVSRQRSDLQTFHRI